MERAGFISGAVSWGNPGPLPETGPAGGAAAWVEAGAGAAAVVATGPDGRAAAGGTTAATGLGCAAVELAVPAVARLVVPACRAGVNEPWAAAEDEAAGADESGTDATGRGVDLTVGAAGVVDEGAGLAFWASFPVDGCLINSLIRSTVDGSRLAKALTLTSSPQFWIRSSNSWLFSPSSFANS